MKDIVNTWVGSRDRSLVTVTDHLRQANKSLQGFPPTTQHRHQDKKLEKARDMDRMDAWNYDSKIERMLTSLKFGPKERLMGTLSGGEIKKVAVAALLLQDAGFMILDEPTNHLDIEVIEFLEEYLSVSSATIFMVTHDRYFLDRVCNTMYELEGGQLFIYRGNYSTFLEKREERIANRAAETDKARNLYRRELEWIRSTPVPGRASQDRGRVLTSSKKNTAPDNERKIRINAGTARLGGKIIHCKDLSFITTPHMLKDFSYNFSRYEKIGIIGGTGQGRPHS